MLFGILFPNAITIYTAYDVIMGVGIGSYLIFANIFKDFNYLRTLVQVTFYFIVFGVIRHLLFHKVITENINLVFAQYDKMLQNGLMQDNAQMELTRQLSENLKEFFINYNPAIWIMMPTLGTYLGLLLLSRKLFIKWEHKTVQMPFTLIYLLLAILLFVLFQDTRTIGLNGLLIVTPLFLIQGISLLHYYWGNYLKKHKFLLILLILAFFFNPYLILLLILIGLVDVWFNFRKIHINGGN